jgi:hypothetical protein
LTGLTAIWAGLHLQLARIADCPDLAMTEGEARTFLQAWQNYLRHYSVAATQKTVDLVTACSVTIFMYVPRGVALSQRRRRGPGMARSTPGPAQVFQFRPNVGPAQPQPGPTVQAQPSPPPSAAEVPEDMTYEPQMEGTP